MSNRIPRTSKKLLLKCKISSMKSGIAEKTEQGWILTDENGKNWFLPVAHIRNSDLYEMTVIE